MLRSLVIVAALACVAAHPAPAQGASHRVAFVSTRPDVRIEVLDHGGRGPALVFLAGFGDTGHVFDDFAPQFADRYHVLALTRRGFGASSHPSGGYDTETLVGDITAVLDSLGIQRATFAGHSFGGTELTRLGARHADRVDALIYLDASYDFARLYADARWQRAFPVPRVAPPENNELPVLRRWFANGMGPGVPDHEIRHLTTPSAGTPRDTTLQRGAAPSELPRITVPVLALWATPASVREWYPYYGSLDAPQRARIKTSYTDQMTVRGEHWSRFRRQVPRARAIGIAGARHFIFLTHPREVAGEVRRFLREMSARRAPSPE